MGTTLQDRFGRSIDYLRVSVTDRCDLRCMYCLPEGCNQFVQPASWLSIDEMERLVGLFARLGVRRVRLTGGEPLTRKGIVTLAARLAALPGLEDLSLSTNATQLARLAEPLRQAGVSRINVSLDSLRTERLSRITGRDCQQQVFDGLQAARAAGFSPIKLNMVVMAGINDDEIDAMLSFAAAQGFMLRLIETMPLGHTGQSCQPVDLSARIATLAQTHGLTPVSQELGGGPARYWASADGRCQVGIITPLSQHFCATCNRVRLQPDGELLLCLGHEHAVPLGRMMRAGASDAELEQAIRDGMDRKPERHEFVEQPTRIVRFMAATGG